jgi:hypothetical protein
MAGADGGQFTWQKPGQKRQPRGTSRSLYGRTWTIVGLLLVVAGNRGGGALETLHRPCEETGPMHPVQQECAGGAAFVRSQR